MRSYMFVSPSGEYGAISWKYWLLKLLSLDSVADARFHSLVFPKKTR